MTIFKIILLIFFIFLLVILQTSWSLFSKQISLIFVLMIVLLIEAMKDKAVQDFLPIYALLVAVLGGLLLDMYSIFPPGLFFLSLLFTFFISYKLILPRFSLSNVFNILIISIICTLLYQVLLISISYLYYFIHLSDIRVIFDAFYFKSIAWSFVLNTLLIVISFWIIKLFSQRYKKV